MELYMQRDGDNKSIWQEVDETFSPADRLSTSAVFDVIIVGGGITGITTAYKLQKQGKKCLLLEARNLCFGTSGGTTAHFNNFFDTTYGQVASRFGKESPGNLAQAARDAMNLFATNIEELQINCDYRSMDGIVYAQNDQQAKDLDELYQSAVEAGIMVSNVNQIPIKDFFQRAISFKRQARFHPVKYVYALARAFTKAGGFILENCFVKEVSQKELLEVETPAGTFRSEKMIYATHTPPGINPLHLRCAPYRSYVMAIELENDEYPESAVYDMMDPYHYYRTQEIGHEKLLIAGGEDHKTGHEEDTDLPFIKLEFYLRGIFKIREIKYRWSSQYYEPADGLAYIGHLPAASENILVATGFGGNGMTYAHITANILSSKILHDTDLYTGLFSPGRVKPIAGFSNFVKENADVAFSLVADRLKIPSVKTLSDIPGNSGETIRYNHHAVAVYKNQQEELFCLNPICTHLKCTVKWNQTEKSWDCPCHGARYSVTGDVITAPSTKPLKRIEVGDLK
jgi:glycine/D-amino acid oxidase-like deaminating enzyme/nitrite reductase/ring-hydroxylating ferredoxin subunit